MRIWPASFAFCRSRMFNFAALTFSFLTFLASAAFAQPEQVSGEANLKLPDLSSVTFIGMDGHRLLMIGILFCIFGLGFGLAIYSRLKNLPVHRAMREISELIYETCKTYLITQGKFLLFLWAFIAVIIVLYFGVLAPVPGKSVGVTLPIILAFSLVGIAGTDGVRQLGRQALSHLPHSSFCRHEHWHDVDQRGAADHAHYSSVCSCRICRPMLHRLCYWRVFRRGGVTYCRRHFHKDRGHRLRPDEDRLQD